MNDFISQKAGEVLAFARIGNDTLKKGKKGFVSILGQKRFDAMAKNFSDIEKRFLIIARKENKTAEIEKEAKKTRAKVIAMRDTYIDGKWDEESELLEWMGFYTGASLVHWRLISGAAQIMKDGPLIAASKKAVGFYSTLFIVDERTLRKIGAAKA